MSISEKLTDLLNSLSEDEKDALYRHLWSQYVKDDVKSCVSQNPDLTLTDEQIEHIAYRFVYCGDYDCNLSYWDNINNLIEAEIRCN